MPLSTIAEFIRFWAVPFCILAGPMGTLLLFILIGAVPLTYAFAAKQWGNRRMLLLGAFALIATLWAFMMHRPALAWDFPGFYIAASVPIHSVHNHEVAVAFGEFHLSKIGVDYFPPYMRPAAFALFLKPLSLLHFWVAYWLWASICLAAYAGLSRYLIRSEPFALLAFAAFPPAILGIIQGQDIAVVALTVVIACSLLLRGQDLWAGILFAVCLYKFNLVLGIPVVLLAHRRWKALSSFSMAAIFLAVASVLISPPSDYLYLLHNGTSFCVNPQTAGLRGLLASIHMGALFPVLLVIFGSACLIAILRLDLRGALALSIAATLYLSPHAAGYDFVLILIPLALLREKLSTQTQWHFFFLLSQSVLWLYFARLAELAAITWVACALIEYARATASTESERQYTRESAPPPPDGASIVTVKSFVENPDAFVARNRNV